MFRGCTWEKTLKKMGKKMGIEKIGIQKTKTETRTISWSKRENIIKREIENTRGELTSKSCRRWGVIHS